MNTIIGLFCIGFGIFTAYKYYKKDPSEKSKAMNVLVTVGVLFSIIGGIGMLNSNDSKKNVPANNKTVETSVNDSYIESVCKRHLQNNFISVTENPDMSKSGKFIALIYYKTYSSQKANYNFIYPIYQDLFKGSSKYSEIVMFAEATLVDKYGNESNDTVMKTMMSEETAKKINWERFDWRNLGDVLDDKIFHQALPRE